MLLSISPYLIYHVLLVSQLNGCHWTSPSFVIIGDHHAISICNVYNNFSLSNLFFQFLQLFHFSAFFRFIFLERNLYPNFIIFVTIKLLLLFFVWELLIFVPIFFGCEEYGIVESLNQYLRMQLQDLTSYPVSQSLHKFSIILKLWNDITFTAMMCL